MPYVLSVDLGTTFTAAAVCPIGGEPTMLSLGSSGYSVPSVLFLREDGTFLAGEAAELRSSANPMRVARYFKRRLGDEIPIRLAGTPFAPQVLVTRLLEWVISQASERQGETPTTVVLTHPANWGPYRRELLQQAASMASLALPVLITEPEAAAIHYVQSERVEPGELLGVYDLGGGTFDAVIMRRTETGFESVGNPAGVERLGGMDFDDVVRSFVLEATDLDEIEETEETITAAYALQSSCIDAKRVLSSDTVADVRVVFPGISTSVRVNRSEFEDRIRPRLVETLAALQTAMDSAGVQPEELSRILLVGGSSRIPLVSALLAQRFGRPLAVDIDPKNTVALGAARFGASQRSAPGSLPPTAAAAPPSRRALSIPNPTAPRSPQLPDGPTTTPAATAPTSAPSETPPAGQTLQPAPPATPPVAPPPSAPAPSAVTPTPAPPTPAPPTSSPRMPAAPARPSPPTPPSAPVPGAPSTTPSTGSPTTPSSPEPASESSELFSVRAESGHRTKLPRPSETTSVPDDPVEAETQAVGLDPKLLVIGVVVLVVVIAVIGFAVLR